jgi:hypothetical protein
MLHQSVKDDLAESNYQTKQNNEENNTTEDQNRRALKVYITANGAKYHTNPSCFHIKVDPYPMILGPDPKKSPCSFCSSKVDLYPSMMVYSTNSSSVFHSNKHCHAIYHVVSSMSEKEAIVKGYSPCLTCSKKSYQE